MARPVAHLATLVAGLALVATARAEAPASRRQSLVDPRPAHRQFDRQQRRQLVPLLQQVVRFATVAGNERAQAEQKAWLRRTANRLGLPVRDAGMVTEIELPGPPGAPVLGLVVHGDVQPVDPAVWKDPPFSGRLRDGAVWGRGTADDKGPLVQALLALQALRDSALLRTHTVRLLVGSDEESGSKDMGSYLASHAAPDYSLVLDALFPAVVGEKAWQALRVSVDAPRAGTGPWWASDLVAGISPGIVPDRARLVLRWQAGRPDFAPLLARLRARPLPPGITASMAVAGPELTIEMRGKSAHAGMNLARGRNALVALAHLVGNELPPGGYGDLLRFAGMAGADLHGASLDLPAPDPLWGGYDVNVATVARDDRSGRPTLTINIRRPPPWKGPDLRRHLAAQVARWTEREGRPLRMDPDFYYADEPLIIDPHSPLVERAMAAYQRAAGVGARAIGPAVVGGGTYAKRIPRAVGFGMWFPGRPYTGHDVDEHVPVRDLERGAHVLIEALVDIACGPPLVDPVRLATD
jgi:acetylornithine deacetylase/succinyl-diaminopimelate desuccinylase-like protein